MDPIQVVLSGNLKKHKALHVSFYDVEWNCEEREGNLQEASPSCSATRTNSFIPPSVRPSISRHVLNACVLALHQGQR